MNKKHLRLSEFKLNLSNYFRKGQPSGDCSAPLGDLSVPLGGNCDLMIDKSTESAVEGEIQSFGTTWQDN